MINIVFCIPGETFSNSFLASWTGLLFSMRDFNVEPVFNSAISSNVYIARNNCLIETESGATNQKPFGGKLDYDYIMWIDSDSVFTPDQFKSLLDQMEANKKLDILSGLYYKNRGQDFTTVLSLKDNAKYKKLGRPEFLTPEAIKDKKELMKVAYTGMGFMLVRRGVFESLSYPWFRPILMKHGGFASEDASFCLRAKKKGFTTWVDPKVIIGHEKRFVWR